MQAGEGLRPLRLVKGIPDDLDRDTRAERAARASDHSSLFTPTRVAHQTRGSGWRGAIHHDASHWNAVVTQRLQAVYGLRKG